ncbi:MAG: hypothetical protein WD670_02060 [Actinomycetota bacterium]
MPQGYGGQTLVEPLRRVLVRSPSQTDFARWREFGWLGEPDLRVAATQHERLCEVLRSAGAEVLFADGVVEGDPDAIYMCDPAIMSDEGALVLRPGKEGRRVESSPIADAMRALGVPVAFEMQAPATAEGGDTMWLDERTLLIGRSYRTNEAGVPRCRPSTCSRLTCPTSMGRSRACT